MDINQLTAWAAGRIEGFQTQLNIETGPTGKPYVTIAVEMGADDPHTAARLTRVANNGVHEGDIWHLGGYAAVRSFAQEIWPYLTPASKKKFNSLFRGYKSLKAGLK